MQRPIEMLAHELARLSTRDRKFAADHLARYLEKLQQLRDDIDDGVTSLKGGYGRPLDINNVVGLTLYAPKGE
jgi:hypothetical protein